MTTFAIAIGVGTHNSKGEWLEVFYQKPLLNPADGIVEAARSALGYTGGNEAISVNSDQLSTFASAVEGADSEQAKLARACTESKRPVVVTILESDDQASSTPEVYLKLHLLSHRLVKPHGVNLAGIFGLLPNVAWTNKGAIALNELADAQIGLMRDQKIDIRCLFPIVLQRFIYDLLKAGHRMFEDEVSIHIRVIGRFIAAAFFDESVHPMGGAGFDERQLLGVFAL